MGIIAGSFTNAQSATETTHSRLVVNHNSLCSSWNPCARFCPTPLRKGCLGQIHIVATVLHQHRPTMTVEPWPSVDEIVRHTKPVSDNCMGNLGSIGGVQVCESPASQPSMFDSVSAHIPLKTKEKVWAGEYIHSSTSTSVHDDCGALAFRRRNCSSYETHPKFDTLEAANLITCI
jgi:hypothetical protein